MVQIDIEYQGDLHCLAIHAPSGKQLETDAPVDNQGRGESFSPTDLLATSLGVCMMTIMGIAARGRNLNISGAKVKVVKHMIADPKRRVGTLTVNITLPAGEYSESDIAVLEHAALTCPVKESLSSSVQIDFTLEVAR